VEISGFGESTSATILEKPSHASMTFLFAPGSSEAKAAVRHAEQIVSNKKNENRTAYL
jgi:hypothetical protein